MFEIGESMEDSKTNSDWFPKFLTMCLPPVFLEWVFPARPHLTLGAGMVAGVIIQHFIPPRGQLRHLYMLLALAIALAVVNAVFF
jgi:hypothetical protein